MTKRCKTTGRFLSTEERFKNVKGDINAYGIYKIINIVNNKYYIGSCFGNNFKQRWQKHLQQLVKNYHPNPHLQHSYNKHGENNFRFEILEDCKRDKEFILEREQSYLDVIVKDKMSYNFAEQATGGSTCKLTEKDCLNIVKYFLTPEVIFRKEVADKYEVTSGTISNIFSGKHYNSRNIPKELLEKCKEKTKKASWIAAKNYNKTQRSLTNFQALELYYLFHGANIGRKQLAELYNTNTSTIGDIVMNRTYKEIHQNK